MTKLVIIYNSNTGNTNKIAEWIAEGAKSVRGVDVFLKKIGEPFSLNILLDDADAVILGSPAHYAYVTPEMRDFLACLKGQVDDGRLILKGKFGAAFGSYGWDGATSIERLALKMEDLGFKMQFPILAKTPISLDLLKESSVKDCHKFGKDIAERISKTT